MKCYESYEISLSMTKEKAFYLKNKCNFQNIPVFQFFFFNIPKCTVISITEFY